MRYVVFSGPDGYPTDMRNTNRCFDLWQIRSSDYPADMRKSNMRNHLCQSSILAIGCGAVRAWRSHVAIDEMGRAEGIR
jgi:hypothetical protein